MKVTMVDVCSIDGFMTQGDDPNVHHWTSKEDYTHFLQLISQNRLVVMGRKTYEAVQPHPHPERLFIVLTSQPERFAAITIPDQLEFHTSTPSALVNAMQYRGYDTMLLVGGGQVNASFLKAGLVDDLWLTIEPVIFGSGTPLLGNVPCHATLQPISVKQLNTRGTLLMHYKISSPATRQS